MRLRLFFLLAIVLALPGCPVPGSLRGIGTGNQQAAPRRETARYRYSCIDADHPGAPIVRAEADDRETAVDQCLDELRRRRARAPSVSCRCRLEGSAQLGHGGA